MSIRSPFPRLACTLAAAALAANAQAQIRVTEFMYFGADGEFIELTNVGGSPVDLTGWSLDDQTAMPGTFDLSAAGIVAPGESIVVTDRDAANFSASWSLAGVVVLGGNAVAPIGRNDAIHVFDDASQPVDVLRYGDEDFPGTIRTTGASGHGCEAALGVDDIYRWTRAEIGDAWGSIISVNGDVGSPGTHVSVDCPSLGVPYCTSPANSSGVPALLVVAGSPQVAFDDVTLRCTSMPPQSVGYFIVSLDPGLVMNPGGSAGTLCLGGGIGRYSSFAMSSGASGEIELPLDLGAISQPTGPVAVAPGDVWRFQCWYRDSILGIPTSNFSEGVEVTFY